jgi:hypothetical protein
MALSACFSPRQDCDYRGLLAQNPVLQAVPVLPGSICKAWRVDLSF